jgi:hypothetical protein
MSRIMTGFPGKICAVAEAGGTEIAGEFAGG